MRRVHDEIWDEQMQTADEVDMESDREGGTGDPGWEKDGGRSRGLVVYYYMSIQDRSAYPRSRSFGLQSMFCVESMTPAYMPIRVKKRQVGGEWTCASITYEF